MFGKKSAEYNNLHWKLSRYITIPFRGLEEYLPVKSDLSNISKKELVKFKEKEIKSLIKIYKDSIESYEIPFENARKLDLEYVPPDGLVEINEEYKETVQLLTKFLEDFEANLPPEE